MLSNLPGNNVFFGTLIPENVHPGSACIFTIFIKMLFSTYFIIWLNIIMNALVADYDIGYLDSCNVTFGVYNLNIHNAVPVKVVIIS